VTNLTRVPLVLGQTANRWEAQWSPELCHLGVCSVTYFASSRDMLNTRLIATPVGSQLTVTGSAVRIPWWLFE
jgi:hypothetical protein